MENERAESIVLASSPQLAACPGKQTVAGGKWGGSAGNSFASHAVLFLIRRCQT